MSAWQDGCLKHRFNRVWLRQIQSKGQCSATHCGKGASDGFDRTATVAFLCFRVSLIGFVVWVIVPDVNWSFLVKFDITLNI